jgi:hypothetical protein
MTTTTPKPPAPPSALIELRGESGRLYGKFDPNTGVIYTRRGSERDRIDMRPYLKAAEQPTKDRV